MTTEHCYGQCASNQSNDIELGTLDNICVRPSHCAIFGLTSSAPCGGWISLKRLLILRASDGGVG